MIIDFEWNMNPRLNELACSKCGKPLNGEIHVVSEEMDEEGHEWRMFCGNCWEEIQESELSLEQIYKRYKVASWPLDEFLIDWADELYAEAKELLRKTCNTTINLTDAFGNNPSRKSLPISYRNVGKFTVSYKFVYTKPEMTERGEKDLKELLSKKKYNKLKNLYEIKTDSSYRNGWGKVYNLRLIVKSNN